MLGLALGLGEDRFGRRWFGLFLGHAVGLDFPVVVVPCIGHNGGALWHGGGLSEKIASSLMYFCFDILQRMG